MSDRSQVNYEPVGRHLATLRRQRGLTLREVSEAMGHASTEKILSFERGEAAPPLTKLKVLTELYQGKVDLIGILLECEKQAGKAPPPR